MLLVVIAPWSPEISVDDRDQPGFARRVKGTLAGFILNSWIYGASNVYVFF